MKFLLESIEQQIIDALEDHFMDYYGNAGYILPDGVLIGTWTADENEFEFSNHGNVEDYLKTINLSNKKGDFADGSPTMKEIGAIRINNEELENNYIELPLVKPTDKALDTLRDWLDRNQRHYPYIIVTTANFNKDVKYNYDEYTSDDIIKRIKRFYSSGVLYENFNKDNYNNLYEVITDIFSDHISIVSKRGSSYILPDGYFLNLGEASHTWVDDELFNKDLIDYDPLVSGDLTLVDDYKAIRLGDGTYIETDPYVELPTKLPTYAQLNSLEDWISQFDNVFISVRGDGEAGCDYNLNECTPDYIIKRIKRYYSSGILYEKLNKTFKPIKESSNIFYVGKTEVIQNPTDDEYRDLYKEIRKTLGSSYDYRTHEPLIRQTYDDKGNVYVWNALNSTHYYIENEIKRKFNVKVNQNKNFDLDESTLNEKIVKKGTKYQVQSEKGRNLGTYNTREEAQKRLKQVEYFKHKS